MALRFFYNGIKGTDGKLHKCSYSGEKLMNFPEGTLTIYNREAGPFSQEIQDAFGIENNTNIKTSYLRKDHIRVLVSHSYYLQVREALKKRNLHYSRLWANLFARGKRKKVNTMLTTRQDS